MVFHAGTQSVNGQVLTAGGRVLCVTTLAASVAQAREQAQAVIQGIAFDGMQHRRDIGHRAL
jgi:phosphoribosylamine--glycine ligase